MLYLMLSSEYLKVKYSIRFFGKEMKKLEKLEKLLCVNKRLK